MTREVSLVPLGGRRIVPGLRPEHAGPLDRAGPVSSCSDALEQPHARRATPGGPTPGEHRVSQTPSVGRGRYADLFGPTAGDRIRLADTNLFIEITEDRPRARPGPVTRWCSAAAR